ncbi:MAG: tyrosine-protein phosphatase, partial [Bacteroidaceae bacterium]|nr:tyrosine-protein phosphatase [Bacteroidaceae bacterium]
GYNTQLVTINFGENIATNTWGDKLCYNPSGTGLKKEVYMYCDAVPTLQSYTFSFADATVHVYPSLYDAYMANTAWSAYTIIGDLGLDDVSEFTVDGIKYKRLSETDVYVTYPNEAQPSSSNPCTYSGEVVIPGQVSYGSHTYNVTAIGDYAFHFAPVTSLTLPEGITKLGYKAIYQTKLTEITVPNSVTLMDYEALGYNKQLVTIRFGENIAANKWGDKLCIYGDKKYEVYMNCNAVPQLQSYTFDFSGANVHVRPTMYSAFKADPVWSTYDIIGDLWIEYTYADLQAVLTNYAAPTGDAVGTDPGCYTNASVQALNDALASGQTLDESATLEQLNTAINNIIIAYDALESVELQEGYYCIESLYKPGYALVTDAATADTEGIKTASYDATNAKFHFKLTRHGGNWYVQNVETGKYIGTAVGGNTNANPLSITDEPQYEQVITWVAGGAFKIQNIYSGTSATYPYRYYNYGVNVYNYGDGETRIHWRFHPVAPGTYPLDFNLENGRVRAFVHDFEYTAADGSKVGTYNVAPPDRRDQPVPATVFWTRDEASTAQQLTWSTDATFADATTVDVDNSSASYEIYNLIPGNTYYYKVTATVDGSETELINSTFTTSGQVRMIKADGVSNIRDLGGWPTESGYTVAYGKIFRGAAFTATSITPEGIEAVRATGVRAELDLRDSSQDGSMSASLLGTDVDYKRIALAQTASHMNGLTGSKNQYIQCVQYVLNCVKNDKPVYFHCAIGRDRTGTLAFLLQGVLGMSKSDIYKDYELTNFSNLNTPCSKTQLDEMFTMIEGLEGATMEDKFYTYLTTELGISAADIDEYKAKMLNLPSALTPAEVQTMVSEAAAAGSTTLDLTGYDFNGDVSAADMQAPGTNLMVIVDPASGITGQNIISDGTCESLVLTDGQPFAPGMEFTATTATYATTVADGVWYSAVLPYDFAIPEGVQVAANASLSGTTVTLEQLSGNVPANTPFIYKKDGGGDITFAATDATVAAADEPVSGVLKGTYAGIPAESAAGMLTLQGEGATFAVTSTSISAFSAYLDSGQEADAYDILIDDPTGVQSMVNGQWSIVNGQSVYDLNGRKLPANSHVRGIVIVNGKKVLKK